MPNSLCNFWKHRPVFLQTLHQSSMPSNITPLFLFCSNILYFEQKEPIKVQMSAWVKIRQITHVNLKRQVRSSSNFASFFIVMTHKFPVNFNLIHFQLRTKGSHLIPILRISSALVKIYQIRHVTFGSTSQFSFKFFIKF